MNTHVDKASTFLTRNREGTRSMRRNASYCAEIDVLIPAAEREANKKAGPEPLVPEKHTDVVWVTWAGVWNRHYMAAMDRLAAAKGIRKLSYQT